MSTNITPAERLRDAGLYAPGDAVLSVRDLNVRFNSENGVVHAVRGVDFDLLPGKTLGIVGESGSGKSVTSMAIMGLLPETADITGSVRFKGKELLGLSDKAMCKHRGSDIAMVFQDPLSSLTPVYTVGTQIIEALTVHNPSMSKQAKEARAVELLRMVGIPSPKDRLKAFPHEFSGGMRQRVMIAMAVINNPDVIIADEPTTALDVTVQAQILEKLMEVKDAVDAAIVLITHDLGVVAGMAHRVMVMYAGRQVEIGTTDQVFRTPRMPYTAGLLGSIPSLDATEGRLRPIPGAPPSLINLPRGCPFSPRCPLVREHCREQEPPLYSTDQSTHVAACHYWDELAELDDPVVIFRAQGVPAS